MSKNIRRYTAALFIAAGALSMSAPAMAATPSIESADVVEIQRQGTVYQPAIWGWPQKT
ncbi:hypothetical protein [Arthrobacter castelli]|uniref:hypothetical protein n=1 Tax=Arthrobacter castelli TaxID=271431 RepID=UPI000400CB16|nr:hypothetical protein [Arthrobacter castelli]